MWLLSDASDGKETGLQCKRPRFDFGREDPEEGNGNPTPVVLPGDSWDRGAWAGYKSMGFPKS